MWLLWLLLLLLLLLLIVVVVMVVVGVDRYVYVCCNYRCLYAVSKLFILTSPHQFHMKYFKKPTWCNFCDVCHVYSVSVVKA